ncbi:MAG: riboflavin kinase [Tidjanibacter sp.]|nr:riboflavin kinase [Tidjanibacter sp.]
MEIIVGVVVRGNGLGHGFGFPTANIEPQREVLSANGVYVAEVEFDGIRYGAVVNIGHSPSVVSLGKRRVEAHIFDFAGDIYGRKVELLLLKFLRAEKKFASKEELITQIASDRDMAEMLYNTQPVRKL